MMKKFLRVTFSLLLSLFIALLCLAGGICHMAQNAICDPAVLVQAAHNSSFDQSLYEEIRYDWENLISITGVTEPESMMAILTQERVTRDVMQYIEDAYTGIPTLDTDDLRSQLEEQVRQYAYSHNIDVTPDAELEQNIQDLVNACISDYRDAVQVPLLPTLLGYLNKLSPFLSKLTLPIAVGVFVLILFLFFLQKERRNTVYYLCLSVVTGGIVLTGADLIIRHYNVLNRLPFTESALKTLVVTYLTQILDAVRHYGQIYLLVAALLLLIYLLCCTVMALIRSTKKAAPAPAQQSKEAPDQ